MTGIELIAKERKEQIEKHGFCETHDMEHDSGQLLKAAMFAMTEDEQYSQDGFEKFEETIEGYRHSGCLHNLIVAGALIAAEIDRLNALANEA